MNGPPIDVIMLAGALHPPVLQRQLGIPPICLPLGDGETLLTAWMQAFPSVIDGGEVQVAVNNEDDARAIGALLESAGIHDGPRVVAEPASWRGTGGILRDLCPNHRRRALMVIEAHCLPPPALRDLTCTLDEQTCGVVATTGADEPAGIYLFDRATLDHIPLIGYFDLKEQFLPALSRSGHRVRAVPVADHVPRLRDRASYLDMVRTVAQRRGSAGTPWISPRARVCTSARAVGDSVIEAAVIVEEDAVVHDSVLLEGSVVERGAVVSRSVVGPGVRVPAGGSVLEGVAGDSDPFHLEEVAGGASPPSSLPAHPPHWVMGGA